MKMWNYSVVWIPFCNLFDRARLQKLIPTNFKAFISESLSVRENRLYGQGVRSHVVLLSVNTKFQFSDQSINQRILSIQKRFTRFSRHHSLRVWLIFDLSWLRLIIKVKLYFTHCFKLMKLLFFNIINLLNQCDLLATIFH